MPGKRVIADWADTNLEESVFGTIGIDHEKCNGCTWCAQICPAKALEVVNKKAVMDGKAGCMFCGDCQAICSNDAITLKQQPVYPGYYVILERGEIKKPRLEF